MTFKSVLVILSCTVILFGHNAIATDENLGETSEVADDLDFGQESFQEENSETVEIKVPYANIPLYLTHLARSEQDVYAKLKNYEKLLIDRLEILQRITKDYEESTQLAESELDSSDVDPWTKATIVSSHPILSYKMIRRFVTEFQLLKDHIWQGLESELWDNLELIRGKLSWPSQDDFISSTKSLIRLQDTHDFEINDFADGRIPNFRIHLGLTAKESLDLSQRALVLGNVHASTEWWQAAHNKGIHQNDKSVTIDDLTNAWTQSYDAFKAIWPLEVFKTHDVFLEARDMLREHFNTQKFNTTIENAQTVYKALCRGDNLASANPYLDIFSQLCYYETTLSPYYYINPLYIEVYSWNPIVYQVHNFVTPAKLLALSHDIVPAVVSAVDQGHLRSETESKTFTETRISDQFSFQLRALGEIIFDLPLPGLDEYIDLELEASRSFGISSFAVGNHYDPCSNCFNVDGEFHGRTISSVHVVLHAPDLGGEFVFPLLGLTVIPSVGSAIVHAEVNMQGNLDDRAIHGGCPVLLGEKWMLTRHFHEAAFEEVPLE